MGPGLKNKTMKKILTAIAFLFIGWNNNPPKLLKVEADANTWQAILNVIDLSKAEPEQRVAVRNFIVNQLSDTTINKR